MENKLCSIEGCGLVHLAKNLCTKHYYRLKRHGDLNHERKKRKKCIFQGCQKLNSSKGYCGTHAMKIRRTGTIQYFRLHDGKAKERNYARTKKWKKDNWESYKAYLRASKRHRKRATPLWANMKEIISFYKNCPEGYHVDHIIPLNGKAVSGLHVINNLQYLKASENLKKGSKFKQGEFLWQ